MVKDFNATIKKQINKKILSLKKTGVNETSNRIRSNRSGQK